MSRSVARFGHQSPSGGFLCSRWGKSGGISLKKRGPSSREQHVAKRCRVVYLGILLLVFFSFVPLAQGLLPGQSCGDNEERWLDICNCINGCDSWIGPDIPCEPWLSSDWKRKPLEAPSKVGTAALGSSTGSSPASSATDGTSPDITLRLSKFRLGRSAPGFADGLWNCDQAKCLIYCHARSDRMLREMNKEASGPLSELVTMGSGKAQEQLCWTDRDAEICKGLYANEACVLDCSSSQPRVHARSSLLLSPGLLILVIGAAAAGNRQDL